ncbi:MAG: hypothetical protein O7A71_08105, partial [Chloroflexi bacterium]|nr:hypothetical protein [Chloroflexota bacterium]
MRWLRRSLPNLLPAALTLSIGLIVADSVLRAGWASEVPALRVVAVLAGLAAIGLARSRVPGWAALLLGLLGGVVVVSGAALALPSLAEHSLPIDRVVALGERLETWVADALQNDISTDSLPFGVVVAAAVWLATWIGAYAYQRWREPWLLVVLPGVVLAVNVSYLGRSFDWHFALYGILAGLLIAEGHRQRVLARASSGSLPPRVQSISLAMVVLVSVGGVAGAHALPRLDREAEWAGTVGLVTTSVADLREDVSRLFAGASPPTAPDGLPLGPVLPLADIGGGIDRLVARVQLIGAEGPTYLRAV